jgi:hypothetical protein
VIPTPEEKLARHFESPLDLALPGDVLSLVGVHAKVRRDGYRR